MNLKTLAYSFIVLLTIINLVMMSCSGTNSKSTTADLYEMHCVRCHGEDGKKGYKGAEDLTETDMDLEDRIEQIKYGEGQMPSFVKKMSEEEIKLLAKYTIAQFGAKIDG